MIAIYLIAGIVALVWAAVYIWRGSLIGGCLAMMVTTACFGHRFFHFDLGPVPLTLDRLVLVVLVVAYLVQRRRGKTDPKPGQRTDLVLPAFLAVLALSGLYGVCTGNQTDFFGPGAGLFRLTAGYLIPFALYWIARQSPLDRSKVSLVHGTLACLGVYLAVTGVLEITGQWWAVFPKHIADPQIGLHFGRARGPMIHSVTFGLYLGTCLLAAWLWRWRFGRAGQLAMIAAVPLMLAGIYFSYTRSVWMGTGLGLLIVLGLTLRGVWRPLVLGGMVSAALMLAATRMDNLVRFQREYTSAETASSVDLRGSFAYISWKMFQDRPLGGVGFGQFPDAKLPYLADRSTELNLEATRTMVHHNGFLSVLTETGLVGFTLYLAVLAVWARSAWALCRRAGVPDWARAHGALMLGVLAVYVCQAAFHELSYSPIDHSLVFLLAGVTVGLRPLAKAETSAACAVPVGASLTGAVT